MDSLTLYFFKSLVISGLLTGWYLVALRNKRMHQYNRFYLLFTLAASLVVPALHFDWFTIRQDAKVAATPVGYVLQAVSGGGDYEPEMAGATATAGIDWSFVTKLVIGLISAMLLLTVAARVVYVLVMSKRYKSETIDGIKLIRTNMTKAPFSFLNYLFWKESIPLDSDTGRLIYEHELTHLKQKHTYDKLACQAVTSIFWMNPFFWLIQKELCLIHEYIADEKAIGNADTEAFARMLLQTHNNGSYLQPEHQFFSSPIKKRLTMLQTSTKTSFARWRKAAILPLVLIATGLFAFTTSYTGHKAAANPNILKSEKKLLLVVDAGHGGQDAGATGNGQIEKDLTMKIAQRISDMAPSYNVEVKMTRTGDTYPTLNQRVEMSNSLHPDYFLSVHVDAVKEQENEKDQFWFVVNIDSNSNVARSRLFASHILDNTAQLKGFPQSNTAYSFRRLHVLKMNNAPALLLEIGNIKSKSQVDRLRNENEIDQICGAILQGVVNSGKES